MAHSDAKKNARKKYHAMPMRMLPSSGGDENICYKLAKVPGDMV